MYNQNVIIKYVKYKLKIRMKNIFMNGSYVKLMFKILYVNNLIFLMN